MSSPASQADGLKRFAYDASAALREVGTLNFDQTPIPRRLWRSVFVALLALLGAVQYALFFGTGGHAQATTLTQSVLTQRAVNQQLVARNAELTAEVFDLRNGEDAIEERARGELGLIRADETFYQVVDLDPVESQRP